MDCPFDKSRANDGNWTRDLFLTKEALYPWATSASLATQWTQKMRFHVFSDGTSKGRMSGRRDSNSRPSAWKADALPTELLPQNGPQMYTFKNIFQHMKFKCCYMVHGLCGESRIRTYEGVANRFTVCPRWPLEYLPKIWADGGTRTHDLLITNQLL